jgi:uncharacterized membrane protein
MDDLLPGLSQSLNVHPLFVHFPIALWSFALLLWTLGQFLDRKDFLSAARWALYAGTLGGLLTVATGYLASNGIGHDSPGHDFVHVHRNFMLVATALALVTTGMAFFLRDKASAKARWLVCGALFLTVSVTTLGADRGALLVYTYGMGTQTAPKGSSDHGSSGGGSSDHGSPDHQGTSSNSKETPAAGDHH